MPQTLGYVFDKLAAAASFTYQNTPICFFGHTHVPVAFIRTRWSAWHLFEVQDRTWTQILCQCGSVGQSRDGVPRPLMSFTTWMRVPSSCDGWITIFQKPRPKSEQPVCPKDWLSASVTQVIDPAGYDLGPPVGSDPQAQFPGRCHSSLPVLRLIKQAHPQSAIHWWISSELAPFWSRIRI